ncbi:hypothetical protein RN001_004127 [Aquatica leii]|uniref:Uncharacterized protein n=1 Tax=Aquatica leii TaxID=1421715 RepID=A0AAN7PRV9_9COLE|nr:hypothetical protein RN001_004127 [Aquatica leii]
MDYFLTNYNEDYCKKSIIRSPNAPHDPEFKDPAAESFKNYLQLSSDPTPMEDQMENADDYLHKHEKNHPKLAKIYFDKPINNEVMTKDFIFNGRSMYQCDYCDLEKDNAYKEEIRQKNLFRLPDDWDIPLSSHRYSHRNPVTINPNAMERTKIPRVPNNLDPQPHIRKILKVQTGKTEYGGVIGDLGELIMNDELHGKVTLV